MDLDQVEPSNARQRSNSVINRKPKWTWRKLENANDEHFDFWYA